MPANGTEHAYSPHVECKTATTMAADVKAVLDIGDIAEMFNCSREKIKRMARRGEIPAFKFGKHWYVRRDDLERFLATE
jgi:excisionase family DNA binding protein